MDEQMRFNAIFQWNMTTDEAETFNLACIYEAQFLKVFGNLIDGTTYRKNTIPKSADPRKSNLFRHCWKLRRETRGLLESRQYVDYIHANFKILKMNYENGKKKGQVRIDPNSICGDNAWARWKLVERWNREKNDEFSVKGKRLSIKNLNSQAAKEIDKTKKFIFENCDGEPTLEKMKNFIENGFFKLWVAGNKVSKIYVTLSPFIQQLMDVDKFWAEISVDSLLVRERITEEVQEYFRYEFIHENYL